MTENRRITDKLPGQPLQWEEPAPGGLADDFRTRFAGVFTPSAAPAAGQAGLAKANMYVECRECVDCGHIGINDSDDKKSACHRCDWSGPSPEQDECPGCGVGNCMGAACPKCSALYRLTADATLAAPVAADTEQATERSRFGSPELQARILANLTATPADAGAGLTDCDAAFDNWYAAQSHQLTNEQLCRLIWQRGWQAHERASAHGAPVTAEPVGKTVAMPGSGGGFTMCAFTAADVPVGTPLYAHPAPARQAESLQTRDAIRAEALEEAAQQVERQTAFIGPVELIGEACHEAAKNVVGHCASAVRVLKTHPSASPTATDEKKGGA